MNFSELQGETLVKILVDEDDEEIRFFTKSRREFRMLHHDDCCEFVYIEDICGDLDDLIGSPITNAEEVSDEEIQATRLIDPKIAKQEQSADESFTWTFYKLDTAKGGVTLRWFGSSNGYYSESVSFEEITPKDDWDKVAHIWKPIA